MRGTFTSASGVSGRSGPWCEECGLHSAGPWEDQETPNPRHGKPSLPGRPSGSGLDCEEDMPSCSGLGVEVRKMVTLA
jgi:hypothetical protein